MNRLCTLLKGIWIGATMTVPGVSGGTMAILIGIYEQLLEAVNGLIQKPKQYIPFLLQFVCGAGIGFLLFAKGITFLLDNSKTGDIIRLLFCGIVAGGIPLLSEKSKVKKPSFQTFLFLFLGAAMVLLLVMIPKGTIEESAGIQRVLLMFAGGFLIAVALILPGISATHMLYVLDLYETVLMYAYAFKIIELLPLMAGGLCGMFLTTKLLDNLLKRYPTQVYLMIIGFVAASMITLFPQGRIDNPGPGILLAVIGFLLMCRLGKREG